MDLSTLSMDAVRALDDSGLRRVIARLKGFECIPWKGAWCIAYQGIPIDHTWGNSEADAWGLAFGKPFLIPDWLGDLNATFDLIRDIPSVTLHGFEQRWDCKLRDAEQDLTSWNCWIDTPARAICLAWIALQLAQQKVTHG